MVRLLWRGEEISEEIRRLVIAAGNASGNALEVNLVGGYRSPGSRLWRKDPGERSECLAIGPILTR